MTEVYGEQVSAPEKMIGDIASLIEQLYPQIIGNLTAESQQWSNSQNQKIALAMAKLGIIQDALVSAKTSATASPNLD